MKAPKESDSSEIEIKIEIKSLYEAGVLCRLDPGRDRTGVKGQERRLAAVQRHTAQQAPAFPPPSQLLRLATRQAGVGHPWSFSAARVHNSTSGLESFGQFACQSMNAKPSHVNPQDARSFGTRDCPSLDHVLVCVFFCVFLLVYLFEFF